MNLDINALAVDFLFEYEIYLLDKNVVWLYIKNYLVSPIDDFIGSKMLFSSESLIKSETIRDSSKLSAEVYENTFKAFE